MGFHDMPRGLAPVLAVLLFLVPGSGSAQEGETYCRDYTGEQPPELIAAPGDWMNYDSGLTLAGLRGHVVWLEFSFIACGGCQMMKSHLQGFQQRYGPEGLVVVEVNNGAFDSHEAVAEEIRHLQPNYPVLWDKQGRTCDAFGVTKYGTAYLIGVDGRVIWGGNPLDLSISEIWRLIQGALRKVDLNELHSRDASLLVRDLTTSSSSATSVQSDPVDDQGDDVVRYTLGWDFAICTADNSMEIEGVDPGGPSFRAGLRIGDTVVAIDELELSEIPFSRLKDKLHQLAESSGPVRLRVRRGERAEDLVVSPVRER